MKKYLIYLILFLLAGSSFPQEFDWSWKDSDEKVTTGPRRFAPTTGPRRFAPTTGLQDYRTTGGEGEPNPAKAEHPTSNTQHRIPPGRDIESKPEGGFEWKWKDGDSAVEKQPGPVGVAAEAYNKLLKENLDLRAQIEGVLKEKEFPQIHFNMRPDYKFSLKST